MIEALPLLIVGVAFSTLPLESASVKLCPIPEPLLNVIVTMPALACSVLVLNISPDGAEIDTWLPPAELVVEADELAAAVDELAAGVDELAAGADELEEVEDFEPLLDEPHAASPAANATVLSRIGSFFMYLGSFRESAPGVPSAFYQPRRSPGGILPAYAAAGVDGTQSAA